MIYFRITHVIMMMCLKAIKKSEKEAIEIMAYKADKIVTFFATSHHFCLEHRWFVSVLTIFGALVL